MSALNNQPDDDAQAVTSTEHRAVHAAVFDPPQKVSEFQLRKTGVDVEMLTVTYETTVRPYLDYLHGYQDIRTLDPQALTRDADTTSTPELPVTQEYVQISASACFDVAGYYLQAVDIGRIGLIHENGVAMLEKMHGGHTYLLLHSTVLNGVELPKGTLMQKNLDDKWAMLRLTPFCFDSEEDQLATGSELAKSFEYQTALLQRFGSTALLSAMRDTVGGRAPKVG